MARVYAFVFMSVGWFSFAGVVFVFLDRIIHYFGLQSAPSPG